MCASLYALADHGLCELIFWKHLFFVLVNKTINDDHGDCDTRRDQSEDETTVNDRATADHVRGCRIAHGCTHLISS